MEKGATIDWSGFLAFTTSIVSFLLSLTYAAYGLADETMVLGFLGLSIFCLVIFALHERRCPHPLLDLKLLKIREFTGGVVAQLLNAIAWGAVLLLLSLYFQLVLGLGPFDAGIRMIPFDIAFLFLGPLSGKLSDKYGHVPFTTTGIILTSISLYLFSTMDASTPYLTIVPYMVLFGAGIGVFSSPNMSSIMGSVPPNRRGVSSALRATFFNVGFTISLNLAILIMSLVVPYTLVTQIISSQSATILQADKLPFLGALKTTYLWLAILNTFAIIPSILRGKSPATKQDKMQSEPFITHSTH